MKRNKVILHITDLHFSDDSTRKSDARTIALGQLVDTIAELPDEWHPSVVCLTGDVASRGRSSDYEVAGVWIAGLINRFSLPIESLFICAGNHDVDRDKAQRIARPASAGEADKVLEFPPVREPYASVFSAYSGWARHFGIKPYMLGSEESYLVGQRSHQGISFVALNTAWCSKDGADKNALWVGFPQIQHCSAPL